MMPSITFRPIQPEDMDFLCAVYASTRSDEMALTGWSPEQIDAFLRMQFEAQHQHYQTYYPDASFQVILHQDEPIGRLYVAHWDTEIRLVDIAILPAYRGAGIGTAILTDLLAEGQRVGKPVSIHVEQYNPALRLYERLGFVHRSTYGVYFLMEWQPPAR